MTLWVSASGCAACYVAFTCCACWLFQARGTALFKHADWGMQIARNGDCKNSCHGKGFISLRLVWCCSCEPRRQAAVQFQMRHVFTSYEIPTSSLQSQCPYSAQHAAPEDCASFLPNPSVADCKAVSKAATINYASHDRLHKPLLCYGVIALHCNSLTAYKSHLGISAPSCKHCSLELHTSWHASKTAQYTRNSCHMPKADLV